MGLKLVIERECSRDHQTALRQFLCCEPGGPEWAMDPQRYIRDLSVRKTPKGIMRTLLVVSGDIPLHKVSRCCGISTSWLPLVQSTPRQARNHRRVYSRL